jgi:hypothetical protein
MRQRRAQRSGRSPSTQRRGGLAAQEWSPAAGAGELPTDWHWIAGDDAKAANGGQLRLRRSDGTTAHGFWRLRSSLREVFLSVFMPQGYPESVSDDYLEYQVWDSLQAFCSYTTNTIATKAMLQGMGVGSDSATAAGALVTWILKDGAGMLGRIAFAWAQGSDLDNNSKQWRLVADACDDLARIIQLLAPSCPPAYFTAIMCGVQLIYAVVGVAGGATRNAVTQHQVPPFHILLLMILLQI